MPAPSIVPASVRSPEAASLNGRVPRATSVTPDPTLTLSKLKVATPFSSAPVMLVPPGPVIVSAVVLTVYVPGREGQVCSGCDRR